MLKEIITIETILILGAAIFVFYLIKKQKKNVKVTDSKEIRELQRKLANAIQVEKIPSMEDEEQFVGSASSKKYHKVDCRLAKNIKNKEFGTKNEFKKKKYSACGICLKK